MHVPEHLSILVKVTEYPQALYNTVLFHCSLVITENSHFLSMNMDILYCILVSHSRRCGEYVCVIY